MSCNWQWGNRAKYHPCSQFGRHALGKLDTEFYYTYASDGRRRQRKCSWQPCMASIYEFGISAGWVNPGVERSGFWARNYERSEIVYNKTGSIILTDSVNAVGEKRNSFVLVIKWREKGNKLCDSKPLLLFWLRASAVRVKSTSFWGK